MKITLLLFFLSFINAQIALPTFQAVHKPHNTSSSYDFTSHTFTNCGATGATGPSLSDCTSSYQTNSNATSSAWRDNTDYFNMEVNGIQLWTVPEDGTYRIEVWGAQGALIPTGMNYSNGSVVEGNGGKGAKMRGDFELTEGEKLKILVGQMGKGGYAASGGGGGTNSNSSYAGGGGSYNNGSNQSNEGGLWESHGKCTITKQ